MFTHLILRAVKGELEHQEFVFADGRSYVLGRAADCAVRLRTPDVSRHHCVFEVRSPRATVRDLGSLNGTLLNGRDIGRRDRGRSPEEVAGSLPEGRPIVPGDVLRVGENLFWIDCIAEGEDPEAAASGRDVACSACC